ncbi:MAG: hypothetical protein Q9222_005293 [Ikaeria aurantiellina]
MVDYVRTLAEIPISPFNSSARSWSAEVRSGSIISSYAVSPANTFTCPPYSIKLSKNSSREAQSVTYCSIRDPQPRLISFHEETKKRVSYGGQLKTFKTDLPNVGVLVVGIECIATHQHDEGLTEIDVLCIYEDGRVLCYDQDLTSRKWDARIATTQDSHLGSPKMHVVQATTVRTEQASRTILCERGDALAALDSNRTTYGQQMLLLTTRLALDANIDSQASLDLRIVAIKDIRSTDSEVTSARPRLEQLASLTIPEPKEAHHKTSLWQTHPSSGMLYQLAADSLLVYDLAVLAPRLVHNIRIPESMDVQSFIRISSDIVAISNENRIFVVGSQFSSFQAMYELRVPRKTRPNPREHDDKQSITLTQDASQLLSYHSPSGSAIVLQGRNLLAVDLTKSVKSELLSRKRKRKALLIDDIGQGSLASAEKRHPSNSITATPKVLGNLVNPKLESTRWKDQKKTLDDALEKGDSPEFDRLMVSMLGDIKGGRSYDATTSSAPEFVLDYIIGKMFLTFSLEIAHDSKDFRFLSGLRMHSMYEGSWRQLVRKGLLTTNLVEASLKRQGMISGNNVLSHEALVQAHADQDPSLGTVLALLQSSCMIKVPEVCHALKITVGKFEMLTTSVGLKSSTYMDDNFCPGKDAGKETQLTIPNTDHGTLRKSDELDHLHNLLDAIIAHCGVSSAMTVTKALRRQLSTSELRRVLDILRMKLAHHGWLSPYIEHSPTAEFSEQLPNNKISMIAKLLNCVVDSLGTHGWLLNGGITHDSSDATESVSYMQAAVSAALEGIEEATYLQAMLEDLLLCGKSALNSRPTPAQGPRIGQRSALPMGLKLDQNVSLTKVGAGGEIQRRSQRDIGKLKSRRVPEYSFERITV